MALLSLTKPPAAKAIPAVPDGNFTQNESSGVYDVLPPLPYLHTQAVACTQTVFVWGCTSPCLESQSRTNLNHPLLFQVYLLKIFIFFARLRVQAESLEQVAAFLKIKLGFVGARGRWRCWKGKVIDIPFGKPLQKFGPRLLWIYCQWCNTGREYDNPCKQTNSTTKSNPRRSSAPLCAWQRRGTGRDLADLPALSYQPPC